jgi:hypothetical protein
MARSHVGAIVVTVTVEHEGWVESWRVDTTVDKMRRDVLKLVDDVGHVQRQLTLEPDDET